MLTLEIAHLKKSLRVQMQYSFTLVWFIRPGIVKEIKQELISIIKQKKLKILVKLSELMLDHNTPRIISFRIIMTKKCELTGVLPLKGHNVSHAKNKTKRRFLPNLKKLL